MQAYPTVSGQGQGYARPPAYSQAPHGQAFAPQQPYYPPQQQAYPPAQPGYAGQQPYLPQQPQQAILVPTQHLKSGKFDAGARFDTNTPASIPPPPPGVMPTQEQVAAMQGQGVAMQQKKETFVKGTEVVDIPFG